jgi:hypothetical protein
MAAVSLSLQRAIESRGWSDSKRRCGQWIRLPIAVQVPISSFSATAVIHNGARVIVESASIFAFWSSVSPIPQQLRCLSAGSTVD